MTRTGSLHEWARFLDAHSDEEATAALSQHVARLDAVYDELGAVMTRLWASPTGEVAEVLMVARSCLTEAVGMLESVSARFRAGEREIA
jgi:hypothetical protein